MSSFFLLCFIFSPLWKLWLQLACKSASLAFLVYVRLYFPKRVRIIMSMWVKFTFPGNLRLGYIERLWHDLPKLERIEKGTKHELS